MKVEEYANADIVSELKILLLSVPQDINDILLYYDKENNKWINVEASFRFQDIKVDDHYIRASYYCQIIDDRKTIIVKSDIDEIKWLISDFIQNLKKTGIPANYFRGIKEQEQNILRAIVNNSDNKFVFLSDIMKRSLCFLYNDSIAGEGDKIVVDKDRNNVVFYMCPDSETISINNFLGLKTVIFDFSRNEKILSNSFVNTKSDAPHARSFLFFDPLTKKIFVILTACENVSSDVISDTYSINRVYRVGGYDQIDGINKDSILENEDKWDTPEHLLSFIDNEYTGINELSSLDDFII